MAGMVVHQQPGPASRVPRHVAFALCWLAMVTSSLLLVACGRDKPSPPPAVTTADRPAPPASDFPAADGRTLGEVIDETDPPRPTDPVLAARSQVFYPGRNRFTLTVSDRAQRELTDVEIALYIAPIPRFGSAEDEPARGPFVARLVSLATKPEFRSENTASNRFGATAFYLAEIDFPAAGEWRMEALVRDGDRLVSKSLPRAVVGAYRGIPRPGQRPPRIVTPTPEQAGDAASELTTRRPDGGLNEANFADMLGEKPIALLFTSPAFCQSRVCSAVADVAAQLSSEVGDEAEVIQMELYRGNDPDMGVRPQVRRFNLPSDTWLFVIDSGGRVRRAVEGPFSVTEMRTWLEEATRG